MRCALLFVSTKQNTSIKSILAPSWIASLIANFTTADFMCSMQTQLQSINSLWEAWTASDWSERPCKCKKTESSAVTIYSLASGHLRGILLFHKVQCWPLGVLGIPQLSDNGAWADDHLPWTITHMLNALVSLWRKSLAGSQTLPNPFASATQVWVWGVKGNTRGPYESDLAPDRACPVPATLPGTFLLIFLHFTPFNLWTFWLHLPPAPIMQNVHCTAHILA